MGLLSLGMGKSHPATHVMHRVARAIWEGNKKQIAYEHERDTVRTMVHGGKESNGVKYSVAKSIVRQARSQKRPH